MPRIHRVQNRKTVRLPEGVLSDPAPALDLPPLLCNDGSKGVTSLVLGVTLKAGVYEFGFTHGVTRGEVMRVSSQAYIVLFDEREIGFGAAPAIDVTEEERDVITDFRCRFVCLEAGEHAIAIEVIHPWNDFSPNQPFPLRGISLKPYPVRPFKTAADHEHPGRVLLDAWGWHVPFSYQRGKLGGHSAEPPSLEYLKSEAIDESFRWGANVAEFYVSHNIDEAVTINRWPVEWKTDDPIPGRDHYNEAKVENWSDSHAAELCRHAHGRDLLFHWYGHYPTDLGGNDPYDIYSGWVFNLIEKAARDFSNTPAAGWKDAFDGFVSETCDYSRSAFFVEVTRRLWKYNPGAYQIENRGPNWDRPMTACAPNFMIAEACNHMHWNGYDSRDPIVIYDRGIEHGSLGRNFFLSQADCRMFSPNFFGGNTRPDWVLAQCNDFFRGRARHPEEPVESAIWWLNESPVTTPQEMRRYVYGITQDPIKCAVTCDLGTTGSGGTMDRWHRTDMAEFDGAPRYQTRPRSELFHDTSIIQNNHFRACFHTNIDGGILQYDLEGLAHFDSHSIAVELSRDFLSTMVEGVGKLARKARYIEPAGCKAVYREEAEIHSGRVRETRTVKMHSDTPYFTLSIRRESELAKLGTRIGLENHDLMQAGQTVYSRTASLDRPGSLAFMDSRGILPPLAVIVLSAGNITKAEWEPGKALVLLSESNRRAGEPGQERIELAFAVRDRASADASLLAEAIRTDEQEAAFNGSEALDIANPLPFPVVRIIEIVDPDGSPYQVFENGWWMFRGAQPSLEHPGHDYLKVYLPAKGSARIRRYGFIEGAVKNGWGCQYLTAICDVRGKESGSSCIVKVLGATPLIFAPRVQFTRGIASAKLDGRPWHYFEEDIVFLPSPPGKYRLEVEYGMPASPHLARSYGALKSSLWNGKRLTLEFGLPPWVDDLYPGLKLSGLILTEGRRIEPVENATVTNRTERGVVIDFLPGRVVLKETGEN